MAEEEQRLSKSGDIEEEGLEELEGFETILKLNDNKPTGEFVSAWRANREHKFEPKHYNSPTYCKHTLSKRKKGLTTTTIIGEYCGKFIMSLKWSQGKTCTGWYTRPFSTFLVVVVACF